MDDETRRLCEEIVRSGGLGGRIHLALDFFDASINRVGAWAVGARALQKSLLLALLQPLETLLEAEEKEDCFSRLALLEEMKTLPFGEVWNHYCRTSGVPEESALRKAVLDYDQSVTRRRI